METVNEIWKPVYLKEFEDLYEVSNKGNVRRNEKKLSPFKNGKGGQYNRVTLHNKKTRKDVLVHRLVKITFDPIEDHSKFDVHHRDENIYNNELYNLQYLSPKDHAILGIKKGTNKIANLGRTHISFKGAIGQFNKEGYLVNVFEGRFDIQSNGYDQGSVYHCTLNFQKTHRGYYFRRFPKEYKPNIGTQYDLNDPIFVRRKTKNKKENMVQMAFKF